MNPSQEAVVRGGSQAWPAFAWCIPTLLGFPLFLVSFPISRRIPFWPHATLAVVFAIWFLLITPVTTSLAIASLKRTRRGAPFFWTARLAVFVSVLANILVLIGMIG